MNWIFILFSWVRCALRRFDHSCLVWCSLRCFVVSTLRSWLNADHIQLVQARPKGFDHRYNSFHNVSKKYSSSTLSLTVITIVSAWIFPNYCFDTFLMLIEIWGYKRKRYIKRSITVVSNHIFCGLHTLIVHMFRVF